MSRPGPSRKRERKAVDKRACPPFYLQDSARTAQHEHKHLSHRTVA
jgi:hypothetical protein